MNKGFTLKALFLLCFLFSQTAKGQSFTPGKIWPDNHQVHINAHGGGILYDNGTYYWFGEHKTEGETGNVANPKLQLKMVWSSTDLIKAGR